MTSKRKAIVIDSDDEDLTQKNKDLKSENKILKERLEGIMEYAKCLELQLEKTQNERDTFKCLLLLQNPNSNENEAELKSPEVSLERYGFFEDEISDHDEDPNSKMSKCAVCLEEKDSGLNFKPRFICGHIDTCNSCCGQLEKNQCPICRGEPIS